MSIYNPILWLVFLPTLFAALLASTPRPAPQRIPIGGGRVSLPGETLH